MHPTSENETTPTIRGWQLWLSAMQALRLRLFERRGIIEGVLRRFSGPLWRVFPQLLTYAQKDWYLQAQPGKPSRYQPIKTQSLTHGRLRS